MAQAVTAEQPHIEPDARRVELSVVMPAYNEDGNLTPLVIECVKVFQEQTANRFEVIIVNDGSTDATPERCHHLAKLFEAVRTIHLRRNVGQSAALAAGIDASEGDIIVTMDADGQNDPEDIPALLDQLTDGVDCVSGWRVDRKDPLAKRIPSAIQTRLAKLTGPDIHDFGCTLTAYRADALNDVAIYGEGHRYIPAKLYARGYTVDEVPVNHRPRENGKSHYGAGRLFRGFVDLWHHVFLCRYGTRPMHLFGAVGLLLGGSGGLIGAHMAFNRIVFGEALTPHLPRLVLVALLVLAGLIVLGLGVLAELVTRLHYRDERPYRVAEVVE